LEAFSQEVKSVFAGVMKGIMMKLAPLAADIFLKTLRSVDVGRIVEGAIRKEGRRLRIVDETIDLAEPRASVIVVAIGKAALPMAEAAGRVLGDLLTGGIIATNERAVTVPAGFRLFTGGHPVPNEESVLAAEAAIELLRLHNQPESW
jgi:glycerate-2-kinase